MRKIYKNPHSSFISGRKPEIRESKSYLTTFLCCRVCEELRFDRNVKSGKWHWLSLTVIGNLFFFVLANFCIITREMSVFVNVNFLKYSSYTEQTKAVVP